jgi:hypothetical protein
MGSRGGRRGGWTAASEEPTEASTLAISLVVFSFLVGGLIALYAVLKGFWSSSQPGALGRRGGRKRRNSLEKGEKVLIYGNAVFKPSEPLFERKEKELGEGESLIVSWDLKEGMKGTLLEAARFFDLYILTRVCTYIYHPSYPLPTLCLPCSWVFVSRCSLSLFFFPSH